VTVETNEKLDTQGQKEAEERKNLKLRGHRIAYAVHATLSCFATDFLDPVINAYDATQEDRKKRKLPTISLWRAALTKDFWKNIPTKYKEFFEWSHLKDSFLSEFVGDIAGGAIFLAISEFASKPLHKFTHAVGRICSPLVDRLARKSTDEWAVENNVQRDSKEYQKEFGHWKEFQSQNIAFSAIISFFSGALNVLALKYWRNSDRSFSSLIGSKLKGIFATNVLLLGSRWVVPRTVKRYEDAVSERFVEPVLKKIDKTFKLEERDRRDEEKEGHHHSHKNFTDRLPSPAENHIERAERETPAAAAGVAA